MLTDYTRVSALGLDLDIEYMRTQTEARKPADVDEWASQYNEQRTYTGKF